MKHAVGSKSADLGAAAPGRGERPRPHVLRWWCVSACVVFAAAAGTWLASPVWLRAASDWLDVGQPPVKSDYVMVLGGAVNSRPFVAAALVRAGWAKAVLLAPLPDDEPRPDVPASPWADRAALRASGIADSQIVNLAFTPEHTQAEAELLKRFLNEHPAARVMVVTNAPHTRRASWILDRMLGDRADRVSLISAPADGYYAGRWWRSANGWKAVPAEYVKLLLYRLRYGRLVWILTALAILIAGLMTWAHLRHRSLGRSSTT